MCMTAAQGKQKTKTRSFDIYSEIIGIDNRASYCISHRREDFQGKLKQTSRYITGYGGNKHFNLETGTLVWTINDDKGLPTNSRRHHQGAFCKCPL